MYAVIGTLLCVLGLSAGQIVFKLTANSMNETGTLFDIKTFTLLALGGLIYGVTTIAWIWVLRSSDLGKIYPIMALAYLAVPMASYIFLGEKFGPQYFMGVALIIAGVVIAFRAAPI